jgi:ABC-type transport system substrate-binding protein
LRFKSTFLLAMLFSMLVLSLSVIPVHSPPEVYGPRMDKLHIVVYGDPYKEYAALETGEIDITDWPMTKTWIDKFAAMPGTVTLRDYSEIGIFAYGINNQRWPTGCDGSAPHKRQRPETGPGDGKPPTPGADWDPETESWKVYFDPDCPHCQKAWMFRLALALLTDRDYIKTEILKGYGNMMHTYVPVPALAGYLDVENLTQSSFVTPLGNIEISNLMYKRDVEKAKAILDAAGFTVNPATGVRIDPRTGTDMQPIIFYIRLDDPNRKAAGEKLAADLKAIGVPVDARVVEKTVCFKSVMVEYNYHIYTEGYSFGADADFLYGTFHSSQYWAPVGWSGGYQGFCHVEHDKWVDKVFRGSTYDEYLDGVHKSTYFESKYVASIPLWCSAGVQGYRTGWTGVVNHEGYGPSAPITGGGYMWSFLNMYNPNPTHPGEIWWGFKSNLEGPSVITSEWVWDWQVLDLIYDKLIERNPYNLAEDVGFMAANWTKGLTEWAPGKGYATYTLRPGMKWHDGSPVTPADVKFSLEFTRDCGPGVAWNYATAKEIDHVDTQTEDPTLGPLDVRVYFKSMSYLAVHWAGYLPIMNRKIWLAANDYFKWGYKWPHAPGEFRDWDQLKVREYHPWEQDIYNAATGGVGSDGVLDLCQDGCGAWKFVGAKLMEWVDLEANREYYLSQTWVSEYLADAFWSVGDVNRDRIVNIGDMGVIARALGTDDTWPHGTGWGQYNVDADLNKDGKVDVRDLAMAGRTYGKPAG